MQCQTKYRVFTFHDCHVYVCVSVSVFISRYARMQMWPLDVWGDDAGEEMAQLCGFLAEMRAS